MALKNQINKIKDNWLLIVLVILILGAGSFINPGTLVSKSLSFDQSYGGYDTVSAESARSYGIPSPMYDEDFAPEAEERIKTKNSRLSTETERGAFYEADAILRSIVKSSDSFLLDENIQKVGPKDHKYMTGSYSIKVDSTKYDSVIKQLKEIGEIQSFNENVDDITGQYTNAELNLELEKERLERYRALYEEAKDVEDKIKLNDKIFNQERTVKYLEDWIKNLDQRVTYSTIYVTISEKQSEYVNVALVKISELVKSLVNSFNSFVTLLFVVVPWAIGIGIIYGVTKLFRRKKKK